MRHFPCSLACPSERASQPPRASSSSSSPRGIAFTDLKLAPPATPQSTTRAIEASVICLNPQQTWKTGFGGNAEQYDLEHVLAHEIGHVLGLDHPSANGHVMSFRYSEAQRELSTGDRLGAVWLYGSRPAAGR